GGQLYLGMLPGRPGTYTLSGSGTLLAGSEYVGNSGPGTLNQSGGTNNIGSGVLYLGYNAGISGSYSLGGSATLLAGSEYVGNSGPGAFTSRAARTTSAPASSTSATTRAPAAA